MMTAPEMSDAVIVYPRTGFDAKGMSVTLPLGALAAASGAHGEFKVRVIDQRTEADWESALAAELRTKPLCVAVSAMTGTQIVYALQVARLVRRHDPGIPVVWGGMHATLLAEQTLRHPLVDFVAVGEGEFVFRDLLRELAGGRDFAKVPGIGWKDRDGPHVNPAGAASVDLNALPPIPYDLVDVEDYVSPAQYRYPGIRRMLPFQGSRGCPFKCTFCSEPALTKATRFRLMKPEILVARVLELVERYRLDHITFYDEEFFINTRWATRVAELIGGRFSWWAQTRANDLLRIDLAKMERNGLMILAPGLESGSQRLLDWMKKDETVEEYLEANRRLAKTGIIPQYNLMIGFPGETGSEIDETVDLALALMRDNPRTVINQFSPLTPLPGTEFLKVAVEQGFRVPETLEGWSGVARRRLPTPWLQARKATYTNLMYSSTFLHTAKRVAQDHWWLPGFGFDLYSRLVRARWKAHRYADTLDTRAARLVHRLYSPADFAEVKAG